MVRGNNSLFSGIPISPLVYNNPTRKALDQGDLATGPITESDSLGGTSCYSYDVSDVYLSSLCLRECHLILKTVHSALWYNHAEPSDPNHASYVGISLPVSRYLLPHLCGPRDMQTLRFYLMALRFNSQGTLHVRQWQ